MTSSKTLILGIIGQRRSGKGTAAKYFVKEYKAVHFRFSQVLEETLQRLHLPPTRENLIELGITLRKTFGGEVLGNALNHDVKNEILQNHPSLIIVEGMRYPEDLYMVEKLPNFFLVNVIVDEKVQFERLQDSEKPDEQNMTWEQFQEISKRDTEKHIQKLSKAASFHIENNGTLEEFYQKMDDILNKLGYEGKY